MGNLLVGLTGLEPVTSALSGQRSNRLSYRPAFAGAPKHHLTQPTPTGSTRPRRADRDSPQSSARVSSNPPRMFADRLYRKANSVPNAVSSTTLITATSAVTPSTLLALK